MSPIDRRRFGVLLASVEWTASVIQGAANDPESIQFSRNGWMPNNAHLPVLLYRGAINPAAGDPATVLEAVFGKNGWPAKWRNGVYPFHHYHSTAHEVLGFARGHARILLGGENGREVSVKAGDIALLPVGTGHCRIEASSDFLVVGAYPDGQDWDLCRSAPDAAAMQRIRTLSFPASDPVIGANGPTTRLWRAMQ
ncbi:MAG: cupin [Acidobacteria bacterium]|nr:cupin [Acidobacteriota bacterium]